jgi:regulator of protease activity HflC (stomatin/prohibitin superfamily)
MVHNIFLDDDGRGNRVPKGGIAAVAVVAFVGAMAWFVYTQFRIDVPTGKMAILISKTGKNISNDDELAPPGAKEGEYRGVQRKFLTEGRYFYNPYYWDWQVIDQEVIPNGKIGVLISLEGKDLPYGEFLAEVDKDGEPTTKGIVPGVLRAGRYPLHRYLFDIEILDPVTVPAGFKGVVTNLAGPIPDDPNQMLSTVGSRGVQKEVLNAGTHYVNPYEKRIELVDCRSQRFNLAQNKDMGFPSKDGFWVRLDGIIEFRVMPEQAAEVFVTYNEDANGERVDEEIVRKVILPNARSFCRLQGSNRAGRDFISGTTKIEFQKAFQEAMKDACEPLGIEIIQALITEIHPPQKIAEPVRLREIAVQQELNYQQQILQQESEQKLAIEKELVKQKQALVQADQSVVKVTTEAEREREVAVTKANERLAVAKLILEAAQDEAEAIKARGEAAAKVVMFENEAEAAGWKAAVAAFAGDGSEYARFVMFQKMAQAYRKIMVNTADSPLMRIFESLEPKSVGNEKATPASDGTK